MRFNIAYFGPDHLFNLRRDFLLSIKYSLEALGHTANLANKFLYNDCFNIIIGAYFLKKQQIAAVMKSGLQYCNVNTEVIKNDLLNFNPEKTDFLGVYLPMLKSGRFVWDVIDDNMAELNRYGVRAAFLRWGYEPKLDEIEHRQEKDLDFYFFGAMTERRLEFIKKLRAQGMRGEYDSICPYFVRNDRIARARVQLNIIQKDIYTHVNSFRIAYLATNRCAIVSEEETDGAGYLKYAKVSKREDFVPAVVDLVRSGEWRGLADRSYEDFKKITMRDCMEKALDEGFGQRIA